jgi:hypothetical protein
MWLIEKKPGNEEENFLPVNLDNVIYISKDKNEEDELEEGELVEWAIQFNFIVNISQDSRIAWAKWWFSDEKIRDKYYLKILEKLPRLDLGIDDITL